MQKILTLSFLMFSIFFLTGCKNQQIKNSFAPVENNEINLVSNEKYSNQYLEVIIPTNWKRFENEPNDNETLIYIEKNNGLGNISIDNIQNYLTQPNSVTIKQSSPVNILEETLNSIEETIKTTPNLNWQNFRRDDDIKAIDFKGFSAAEASFLVDENILGDGKIVERKIKRIVLFTENDLWNIVFAPSEASLFDQEEKDFNTFIESLKIK